MTKILYIGSFCEPTQMPFINKHTKGKITISATTFQKALLSGFENEERRFDYIINIPDLGSFPLRCSTPFFHRNMFHFASMNGVNSSFFNFTYIKRYSIYRSLMREATQWLDRCENEKVTIVVYSLIYPYLKAAVDLKQKYPHIHICCIVLDLPEFFGDNTSVVYRILGSFNTKQIYSITSHIDSFVLLTEAMKERLNIQTRPYLVMEGIYNVVDVIPQNKMHKTILYSGKLDIRFGIKKLIEAFGLIKDEEFSLWICGQGLESDYVKKAAKKDKRIKFWGLVEQSKVFEMQHQANLLINPRNGDAEYTKYSFPSKTMEYMASGTPTVMYRLPGLPSDYEEHLVLIPDNSLETMAAVLEEWGNKNQKELDNFGEHARRFIIENKNSNIQARHLINFLLKIAVHEKK